jgi:hypothetical protein
MNPDDIDRAVHEILMMITVATDAMESMGPAPRPSPNIFACGKSTASCSTSRSTTPCDGVSS